MSAYLTWGARKYSRLLEQFGWSTLFVLAILFILSILSGAVFWLLGEVDLGPRVSLLFYFTAVTLGIWVSWLYVGRKKLTSLWWLDTTLLYYWQLGRGLIIGLFLTLITFGILLAHQAALHSPDNGWVLLRSLLTTSLFYLTSFLIGSNVALLIKRVIHNGFLRLLALGATAYLIVFTAATNPVIWQNIHRSLSDPGQAGALLAVPLLLLAILLLIGTIGYLFTDLSPSTNAQFWGSFFSSQPLRFVTHSGIGSYLTTLLYLLRNTLLHRRLIILLLLALGLSFITQLTNASPVLLFAGQLLLVWLTAFLVAGLVATQLAQEEGMSRRLPKGSDRKTGSVLATVTLTLILTYLYSVLGGGLDALALIALGQVSLASSLSLFAFSYRASLIRHSHEPLASERILVGGIIGSAIVPMIALICLGAPTALNSILFIWLVASVVFSWYIAR